MQSRPEGCTETRAERTKASVLASLLCEQVLKRNLRAQDGDGLNEALLKKSEVHKGCTYEPDVGEDREEIDDGATDDGEIDDGLDLEKEAVYDFGPRDKWSSPPSASTHDTLDPLDPCVEAQAQACQRGLGSEDNYTRRLRWPQIAPKVSARWGAKRCMYCHRIIHDIRCVHYDACPFCERPGCAGTCSQRALWPKIPAGGEEADVDSDDESLPLASDDGE